MTRRRWSMRCAATRRAAARPCTTRYKRRVFALSSRIAGPADAEEVAQEAFIRIFRGVPRFRGDSALGTWIYRLTVNAALSHRARRPPPAESFEARAAELPLVADPHDGDAVLRSRLERCLGRATRSATAP